MSSNSNAPKKFPTRQAASQESFRRRAEIDAREPHQRHEEVWMRAVDAAMSDGIALAPLRPPPLLDDLASVRLWLTSPPLSHDFLVSADGRYFVGWGDNIPEGLNHA